MNSNEIMKALAEPFPSSDIEWRLQVTNADKTSGLAVPYITNRAIQKRLDEVVGPFNWQNTFIPWQGNSQLCGISIFFEDRGEWITKYDGAPNSEVEAVKGGLSDASKRAAVQWSIGRYLYGMEGVWVDVEQKGKTVCIKKGQQKKLDDAHDRAVALLKGEGPAKPPQSPPQRKTSAASRCPAEPPPSPPQRTMNTASRCPANPPIGGADNVTPLFPDCHTVVSVTTSFPPNGPSTTLELKDPQGKTIHAYLRGIDPAIQNGVRLSKLTLTEKTGPHGIYYIVDKYEIAAPHAA
jgi:hypothetical protein